MARLILTADAAGAGWLTQGKRADRIDVLGQRLVCDRLPTAAETENFFAPRRDAPDDIPHWQDWVSIPTARRIGSNSPGLIETCRDFDEIELWIDPVANAQLVLLQLLDFLRPHGEIVGKLVLRQADTRIAERGASDIATWMPPAVPVDVRHLETARRAWSAFRQPTPAAWCGLLAQDLSPLPWLRRTVLSLLAELPAAGTALGATEATLLNLIEPGGPPPFYLPGYRRIIEHGVFDYWEVGRLLDGLAEAPAPAVLGLDERPFDMRLHDDAARYRRYKASRLSLSDLGHALLASQADLAAHHPIQRWWGGTELTNARLWRWDAANGSLISPSDPQSIGRR